MTIKAHIMTNPGCHDIGIILIVAMATQTGTLAVATIEMGL